MTLYLLLDDIRLIAADVVPIPYTVKKKIYMNCFTDVKVPDYECET